MSELVAKWVGKMMLLVFYVPFRAFVRVLASFVENGIKASFKRIKK